MVPVIETKNLRKEFRTPFGLRKIPALRNLNLKIKSGEVFSYLGPNGAGKTTTFKLLLGLIYPTKGTIYLWGKKIFQREPKARIGFLPENPYFYRYLTAQEYLHFSGQLFGLKRQERQKKVDSLLEMVGLSMHHNDLIKTYSKGMLQRLGVAQALINDPQLLILDEPFSGLDPLGRKEFRDIILQLKAEGKTIIFSTHILSDVETICDRIGILINGTLKDCGPVEDLLTPKINSFEISIKGLPQETIKQLTEQDLTLIQKGTESFIIVGEQGAYDLLSYLLDKGGKLISFTPRKATLEQIYINELSAIEE